MAKKTETKKQAGVIQPEVNIGLIGHVDHGKTTLTKILSGKWTDTHSEEIKRGITIRLGYADTTFYKCKKCPEPDCYSVNPTCSKCNGECEVLRKISFVDAPGHESLMATMLAGATIVDGAILLIAANEKCPQPQTREHLMALEIMGAKNIIVVQNKIDLVSDKEAKKNYEEIREFLKGTAYKEAVIIPMSAQKGVNKDLLIKAIEEQIPTPKRDPEKDPIMLIARSFDINKPGIKPKDLVGGVLGGSLKQGLLKKGEEIEISPGLIKEEKNKLINKTVRTGIVGLRTGDKIVEEVGPGGSIGVLTGLDPSLTKSDGLGGNIAGSPGKLPPVHYTLKLKVHLLKRVVGAKKELTVEPIKMGEPLMLNVNSAATVGVVIKLSPKEISCQLKLPVCAEKESRVAISRRVENRFRLIGYGIIK